MTVTCACTFVHAWLAHVHVSVCTPGGSGAAVGPAYPPEQPWGLPTHLPAVEMANVLHVSKDDSLLGGHSRRYMGAAVQVLHVVALQELQLAHKGLLRAQQLLDDGAGGDGVRRDPGAPEGGGRPPPPMQPTAAHLQNKPGNVGSTPKATWRPQSRSCPCLPDPHLSLVLYSSSDTASPGNSGASVGPHSGDSW